MSGEKHSFLLRYRDRNNSIKDSIICIPEEDYRESISYEENIQDIVSDMFNEGGFWVDSKTIVPFHMVMSVECYDEKNKQQNNPPAPDQNKGKNKRFFRHRSKNKYNNSTQSTNQVISNGNSGQPKSEPSTTPQNPV